MTSEEADRILGAEAAAEIAAAPVTPLTAAQADRLVALLLDPAVLAECVRAA